MTGGVERLRGLSPDREQRSQFGAFLQVFVKKRDSQGVPRIACLSYPLPPGITWDQATGMLSAIAGDPPNTNVWLNVWRRYESKTEDLFFLSLRGASFDRDMFGRFLSVPQTMLRVNQKEIRRELVGGVLKEFNDELRGTRHESAQASVGKHIFSLSYRFNEEDYGLYGKDRQGNEGKRLSQLAMEGDEEHKVMLEALERELVEMDEGVVLHIDKSPTVRVCCVKFFKEKLFGDMELDRAITDFATLFFDPNIFKKKQETNLCSECAEATGSDKCDHKTLAS